MKFFSKEAIESDVPVTDDLQYGDSQDPVADRPSGPKVGELDFDESTRGGLGRHLGIWSTIFLMYVPSSYKVSLLSLIYL